MLKWGSFLIVLNLCLPVFSGQEGNGGDGFSILWRKMAQELHKELVMEDYRRERQIRDIVDLELYLQAILFTDVETTDKKILDNMGKERTARFITIEELQEKWMKQGLPSAEIERRKKIAPYGSIEVNRDRFKSEYTTDVAVSFQTIFHEYLRVMGIDDDNYKHSDPIFEKQYFDNLYAQSSATTKRIIEYYEQETIPHEVAINIADRKIFRIDAEIAITEIKIDEMAKKLEELMKVRGSKVEAMREQMNKQFKAMALAAESMGFMPMPFGSYRRRVIEAFGAQVSEGLVSEHKLTEFQVIETQVKYSLRRFESDMSWVERLDEKRKSLFWDSIQ